MESGQRADRVVYGWQKEEEAREYCGGMGHGDFLRSLDGKVRLQAKLWARILGEGALKGTRGGKRSAGQLRPALDVWSGCGHSHLPLLPPPPLSEVEDWSRC
jgi:hypothetical protein